MKSDIAAWIIKNYSKDGLPSGKKAKLYLIGSAIGTKIRGVGLDTLSERELCKYCRIAINKAYRMQRPAPESYSATRTDEDENPLSKIHDEELHRWANLPTDEENPNIELDRELAIKELKRRRRERDHTDDSNTRSLEANL